MIALPRWLGAALVVLAAGASGCSLEETALVPVEAQGELPVDAGLEAGDAAPGQDGGDAGGSSCTFTVSAPDEVTLGTRIHVTSGLACTDDPALHTCTWRAQWSDDNDAVPAVEPAPRPCRAGDAFDFTAAAPSNDTSSVYWVTLAVDRIASPTESVWVSEVLPMDLRGGAPLGKVFDIAIDSTAHRAWIAAEAGLFAMSTFENERAPIQRPPKTADCADVAVACSQSTVSVAGGLAFSGMGTDHDVIVRAQITGDAVDAVEIPLPETTRIRSIIASRAQGADGDPVLYVTSPTTTWVVDRGDLDAAGLAISTVLATGGADLTEIVATAIQNRDGSEALWRLEPGGSGELQRLASLGDVLPSLAPEDVLDKSGACLAVWNGLLVIGQRDGHARAVDLDAVDPDVASPIDTATTPLELPLADDPDGRTTTLEHLLDLAVSEDGRTLFAVSTDTLYRVAGGVIFRSRAGTLPTGLLSVAALSDARDDEVVLVGTATGLYITRADMHPR